MLLKFLTAAAGPSGWSHIAEMTAKKSAPALMRSEQFSGLIPPIATQGTVMKVLHFVKISGDGRPLEVLVLVG